MFNNTSNCLAYVKFIGINEYFITNITLNLREVLKVFINTIFNHPKDTENLYCTKHIMCIYYFDNFRMDKREKFRTMMELHTRTIPWWMILWQKYWMMMDL